jgi:polyisoprenoid-binding protein YceI
MKKTVLQLFVLATLTLTVACKNDKTSTEETNTSEVAVATDAATIYTVDSANSKIEWVGSKPAGKHHGTIALSKGEISVNEGNIESGQFTIDMKSITVEDLKSGDGKEDLEAHLKGTGEKDKEDHFFNTNKFPEGTFEITGVNTVERKTTVEGNLTLKGITKPVNFHATITVDGDVVTLTSETFTINRTQWNVNYSSKSVFDDLKDKFINDDIELKVTVIAKK